MKKIIATTIVTLLFLNLSLSAVTIPKDQRSETQKVTVSLVQTSKKDGEQNGSNQFVQILVKGDNRNQAEVNISVEVYFIGKNSKGLYKLLHQETISKTLPKFSRTQEIGEARFASKGKKRKGNKRNKRSKGGSDSKQFEFRGVLAIIKGPDGKIIDVEGEYANIFAAVQGKAANDVFNSKGEAKDPDFD